MTCGCWRTTTSPASPTSSRAHSALAWPGGLLAELVPHGALAVPGEQITVTARHRPPGDDPQVPPRPDRLKTRPASRPRGPPLEWEGRALPALASLQGAKATGKRTPVIP